MKPLRLEILPGILDAIEERAKNASEFNKKDGDMWHVSHSYVLNKQHTVCLPAYEKNCSMMGYPPSDTSGSTEAFGRHIAALSPYTVLRLVATVRELLKSIPGGTYEKHHTREPADDRAQSQDGKQ